MSNDARLSTALPAHPKTKKLLRRLGPGAGWALVCLILWARENRPDGDLSGMSVEDIELAVDWSGENDAFVAALVAVGFLDGTENGYSLHDWDDHQPWAAGSEARSEKARWASLCRRHGRDEAARLMPDYFSRISATSTGSPATSNGNPATSSDVALLDSARSRKTPAPSPSPYPSPYPRALIPSDEGKEPDKPAPPPCPHADIVAAYHEILPQLTHVRDWTGDRQAFLRSRWREKPERQNLDWWRKYFRYVASCPFLIGEGESGPGREPFYADLEWLVRPKNFRKVIEGKYQRRAAA